jgi:hypothetical protein
MNGRYRAAWSAGRTWLLGLMMCPLALPGVGTAAASPLPAPVSAPALPERAGRLADFEGSVWLFDTQEGRWSPALRNRALTEGDRVATDPGARAELRVGSTALRLGSATELEVVRLDHSRMGLELHRGQLAVRLRSAQTAAEFELRSGEARLRPERAGSYRVDREDDITWASVLRGGLQVQTPDQLFAAGPGQRVELAPSARDRATLVTWSSPVQDRFAEWVAAEDQRDERSASLRHVSPEMTGVEDLDRHGRWERHPEFGMVWSPLVVAAGWAPFTHGRWVWHVRWGWTWVDSAPWGFAPFHYGRWLQWGARWVWTPGVWVARPAFAPALVTFSGPSVGVSVVIGPGRPPVRWAPLPPWGPHRAGHDPRPHHHSPHVVPLPSANVLPPPSPRVGPAPHPAMHPPVYTGGRSRETEDELSPAPQTRSPQPQRPPRSLDPDSRRAHPVVVARSAPTTSVDVSPSRPDGSARAEGASRPELRHGGHGGGDEGRRRSSTEHRARDQRERAQMF